MKINIAGLKEGLNEIEFEHTYKTLGLSEDTDFKKIFSNPIHIHASINKVINQLFFKVQLTTTGQLICDRCLELFTTELREQFRIVYSMDADPDLFEDNEDSGLRLLTVDKSEIDLSADICESVLLMVPMKNVCSDNCQGICPHCGINRNYEQCNCGEKRIDPRWEGLRKLLDK